MTMADQLARALGAKKSGNQYSTRCPAHEDRHPSCMFWQGHTAIRVKCNSGCYAEDIIAIWRDQGVWPEEGKRRRRGDDDPAARIILPAPRSVEAIQKALAIWDQAVDPAGTAVERYLAGRGLGLYGLGPEVIRFHPACPRGPAAGGAFGLRQMAMLTLFRDLVTDQPVAVHRRFLKADCSRDGKPYVLGPCGGAAIKLTAHAATFTEALSFCRRLVACEGVETGIACLMAGYRPVWAFGAAGEVKKLPVLFGVGELLVMADNDPAGRLAAQTAVWNWREAGKQASAIMPVDSGFDYADP